MYELALIEIRGASFAELWSALQWWASVSFGLIALSAFGRDRLNLSVVVELAALRATGEISVAGMSVLDFDEGLGEVNGLIFFVCFIATYVGTITYLWYSYRKACQEKTMSLIAGPPD